MSITSYDVSHTAESSTPAVAWGPIIAGAFAASTLTFILMLVGSGLGLTMVSPWSTQGVTVTTFAASAAIWFVVVQWLSAGVGGYLAGRLRTKWVGVHTDEVYFRDTAHGFLAWALATLLMVGVLGSAISGVVGAGVQAASTVASGAAMGASASATDAVADNQTSYLVDSLFRPAPNAAPANPATPADANAAATSEASRILLASAAAGEVSADDKAYLAQLVSARTGLAPADAQARVDAMLQRVEAAKVEAQQAADTARKAGATAALVGALSLIIGAFVAGAAAALGGKQRDDDEVVYISRG